MDALGFLNALSGSKASSLHPVTAPDFLLTYEQKDITADIAPYLLSFTYTDYLSDQSDELQVSFEDVDARGESGVCLGAIYNEADPVPATSRDLHVLQYANGTRIQHNRKTGDVLIKTNGMVTIDADTVVQKTLTVNGLLTYTAGMAGSGGSGAAATISGSLKATGDISAGAISLQNHVHTEQGDGAKTSSAE
ncbi:Phage P2 baseplate assembly protein gpV [Kingella kingae]|nr:phage baseplate assembly protein V [Kingella kingae]CRZ20630.1 protein of unknown function [Kingella kingae]STR03984.1 Phage P2 baseplate assembly protein gpV [Kingella kingae]